MRLLDFDLRLLDAAFDLRRLDFDLRLLDVVFDLRRLDFDLRRLDFDLRSLDFDLRLLDFDLRLLDVVFDLRLLDVVFDLRLLDVVFDLRLIDLFIDFCRFLLGERVRLLAPIPSYPLESLNHACSAARSALSSRVGRGSTPLVLRRRSVSVSLCFLAF